MKIYIYKILIFFTALYIFFLFTFGNIIKEFKININSITNKDSINIIKNKIREEMKVAINKENYIDEEDAKLIYDFIFKINQEIYLKNKKLNNN